MKPNMYQREMVRYARSLGCTCKFYEDTGWYSIRRDGIEAATVKPDGLLFKASELGRSIEQHHDLAWEIHNAYETAPELLYSPDTASGKYRQLSSCGDVVFAARETGNGDMEYVTWSYTYDRKGYTLGHYFGNDYENAKRDFVTRSEILSKSEMFTENELYAITEGLKQLREANLYHSEGPVESALAKIEAQHPDWFEEPQQSEGMQIT